MDWLLILIGIFLGCIITVTVIVVNDIDITNHHQRVVYPNCV